MAANSVEIANNALIMLGANTITALSDNTKEARLCNLRYNPSRKAVLRSYPWNFAKKRAILNTSVATPTFGFTYTYDLPAGFIRSINVDAGGADYRFEFNKLITDATEVELQYIYDADDTTKFDSMFDEALAAYLAWNISYSLTQNEQLKDMMWKTYYGLVKLGRFVNAAENPPGAIEALEWVESRVSPNSGFVRDPGT